MSFKQFNNLSLLLILVLSGCTSQTTFETKSINSCSNEIEEMRESTTMDLIEKYKNLRIIDTHNHDSTQYEVSLPLWEDYSIDQIAISGYVAKESSILTDELSWKAYSEHPTRYYPFYSGVNVHEKDSIEHIMLQFPR